MKRIREPHKLIRLREWQTVIEPSLRLTDKDRILAHQFAGNGGESCLLVEELREGLRIETRSWVGVVRFAEFDLYVEPKLVGNNKDLVQMVEYATGLDALKRFQRERPLLTEDTSLFDLIALLLSEACSVLVKEGLQSDYVVHEDILPTLRGRLLTDRQMLRHFGRVDQLECRYEVQEANIPENQLLAVALEVCLRRVKNDLIRRQVRHLLMVFKQVCDSSNLKLGVLKETLSYTRLNERYRKAHTLAWLILDGLGISNLLSPGITESFVFLINMNLLFEQFLWRALKTLGERRNLCIQYQLRNRSVLWNALKDKPYSSIVPDFLVKSRSRPNEINFGVPIDAKYKLYDEVKIGNTDIYQCFLYAFAYAQPQSETLPGAILLYPGSKEVPTEQVLEVRDMGGNRLAKVCAINVHIPSLLQEMANNAQSPRSAVIFDRISQTFSNLDPVGRAT